jgi:hypothetical protein
MTKTDVLLEELKIFRNAWAVDIEKDYKSLYRGNDKFSKIWLLSEELFRDLKQDGYLLLDDYDIDTVDRATIDAFHDYQIELFEMQSAYVELYDMSDTKTNKKIQTSAILSCSVYALLCEQLLNIFTQGTLLKIHAHLPSKERGRINLFRSGFLSLNSKKEIMTRYKEREYSKLFDKVNPALRNSIVHGNFFVCPDEREICYFKHYPNNKNPYRIKLDKLRNDFVYLGITLQSITMYNQLAVIDLMLKEMRYTKEPVKLKSRAGGNIEVLL